MGKLGNLSLQINAGRVAMPPASTAALRQRQSQHASAELNCESTTSDSDDSESGYDSDVTVLVDGPDENDAPAMFVNKASARFAGSAATLPEGSQAGRAAEGPASAATVYVPALRSHSSAASVASQIEYSDADSDTVDGGGDERTVDDAWGGQDDGYTGSAAEHEDGDERETEPSHQAAVAAGADQGSHAAVTDVSDSSDDAGDKYDGHDAGEGCSDDEKGAVTGSDSEHEADSAVLKDRGGRPTTNQTRPRWWNKVRRQHNYIHFEGMPVSAYGQLAAEQDSSVRQNSSSSRSRSMGHAASAAAPYHWRERRAAHQPSRELMAHGQARPEQPALQCNMKRTVSGKYARLGPDAAASSSESGVGPAAGSQHRDDADGCSQARSEARAQRWLTTIKQRARLNTGSKPVQQVMTSAAVDFGREIDDMNSDGGDDAEAAAAWVPASQLKSAPAAAASSSSTTSITTAVGLKGSCEGNLPVLGKFLINGNNALRQQAARGLGSAAALSVPDCNKSRIPAAFSAAQSSTSASSAFAVDVLGPTSRGFVNVFNGAGSELTMHETRFGARALGPAQASLPSSLQPASGACASSSSMLMTSAGVTPPVLAGGSSFQEIRTMQKPDKTALQPDRPGLKSLPTNISRPSSRAGRESNPQKSRNDRLIAVQAATAMAAQFGNKAATQEEVDLLAAAIASVRAAKVDQDRKLHRAPKQPSAVHECRADNNCSDNAADLEIEDAGTAAAAAAEAGSADVDPLLQHAAASRAAKKRRIEFGVRVDIASAHAESAVAVAGAVQTDLRKGNWEHSKTEQQAFNQDLALASAGAGFVFGASTTGKSAVVAAREQLDMLYPTLGRDDENDDEDELDGNGLACDVVDDYTH